MIGLEYILNLYGIQHQELAEKLGIKKQNINLWIKGKQNVSKKYLPLLSEMFGISIEYFQKELSEADKLIIQKIKLENEIEGLEYDDINLDKEFLKLEFQIEEAQNEEKLKKVMEFLQRKIVIEDNTSIIHQLECYVDIVENDKNKILKCSDILFLIAQYLRIEKYIGKEGNIPPIPHEQIYEEHRIKFKKDLFKLLDEKVKFEKEYLKSKEEFWKR